MEELGTTMYVLAAVLAVVAFVYSSVGLGGGSSYTALMAIAGVSYLAIPGISLVLNLFVSSVGSYNFIRHRHARLRLVLPFLLASIPMAYFGGSLQLDKTTFLWILWISLLFVAARIYLFDQIPLQLNTGKTQKLIISIAAGMLLGLLAGIVGIGGGVYLVPLILVLGLGNAKEAAACGMIFVFVNSIAGLVARLQYQPVNLLEYWPLFIAALVAGYAGSYLGARRYQSQTIQKLLGVIILIAIVLLARKLLF